MLRAIGDVGFVFASLGVVAFTVLFLVAVRWWTDHLGRAIASVMGLTSLIAILACFRLMDIPLVGGVDLWRAIIYPLLGLSLWVSVVMFTWAQFIAPRVKSRRERR